MTAVSTAEEWTAAETEELLLRALEARDLETVVVCLRLLVTKDARRAGEIYDTMLLGLHVARLGRPRENHFT